MKKISFYIFIFLCAAAILSAVIFQTENSNAADNPEITIVYSSNVLGYYQPCGCSEGEQLGGMYKKSTYLDNYRKEHGEVVIVDSGDLLNENEDLSEKVRESAKLKAELIAQIYNTVGIDAVGVGELDLVLGIDFLKELQEKYNFPFISANLVDEKGVPFFKPYIIKKINGKSVGIFGLIGSDSEMASKIDNLTGGRAKVQNSLKTAKAVLNELSGKVDYIIAVAHQRTNRNWVMAKKVQGINLIVGGHDKLSTEEPSKAGNSLIVQAGEKAQHLGVLEVAMNDSQTVHNTLVPFGSKIEDDQKIKDMISDYDLRVAAMYSDRLQKQAVTENAVSRVAACEPCHADQVKAWEATGHARAYNTLVLKSKQLDPDCLTCHTTRFEQPEGFTMKLRQMELTNVQCENCHGFAEEHISDGTPIPVPKPDMALCVKCHSPYRAPDFEKNAAEVFEKIKH